MTASTITVTRVVPATPEDAFDAWVDPAQLASWWWPQWPDTSYQLDARVGGNYRIYSEQVRMGVTGEFTAVDPGRRLSMTWIWIDGGEPATADGLPVIDTVEVTFTPAGSQTEVRVDHRSSQHLADGGAEQGWNDVLDRLPGHFAQPGD